MSGRENQPPAGTPRVGLGLCDYVRDSCGNLDKGHLEYNVQMGPKYQCGLIIGAVKKSVCLRSLRILKDIVHSISNVWLVFKPDYYKRDFWNARKPRKNAQQLKLPVSKIIVHRTNSNYEWRDEGCPIKVRLLQKFHMVKDEKADIKYNFLICGDFQVYEGRGWTLQGEHTEGYDDQSLGVAFVGKYADKPPEKEEIQALKDLILEGIELGYITKDFKIITHDELTDDTICPGLCLFDDLRRFNKEINKKYGYT